MQPPSWQIEGILPQNSLAMIFGPEGSHKTFIAVDMACSIATGTPFLGRPTTQGRVLYVAAEGGTPIAKRIRAWEYHNQRKIQDHEFTFVMEPLILDLDSEVEEALAQLKTDQVTYDLIVFDTLNMCMVGNESAAHEVAKVVRAAKRFNAELDCTVLMIHHTPKENPHTHRGSGALSAALTTNIRVYFDNNKATTVTCVKQKDHQAFETIVLGHEAVDDSLIMVEYQDETTEQAALTVQLHAGLAPQAGTILNLVNQLATPTPKSMLVAAAIKAGVPRSTAYRTLDRLEKSRLLIVDEDGKISPK
jgi:hypothetical protein